MFDAATILYLYVETPLHAGVGSGLSAVDLPIQRERTTHYPMIQGSGIKGKLRALAERKPLEHLYAIFGPDTDHASDHASALVVSDARILLFPVRSLAGVFAYVTSADVLNRFKRDVERNGSQIWQGAVPTVEAGQALVPPNAQVTLDGNTVMLEEFSFTATPDEGLGNIAAWIAKNALPEGYDYWKQKVQRSLVLLHEDDFCDFALNATEIITRVRLERDTKTVARGALWTEEHLPTDTLLYAPIYASSTRDGARLPANKVLDEVRSLGNSYVQLGGDETVGRGLVRLSWQREEAMR